MTVRQSKAALMRRLRAERRAAGLVSLDGLWCSRELKNHIKKLVEVENGHKNESLQSK